MPIFFFERCWLKVSYVCAAVLFCLISVSPLKAQQQNYRPPDIDAGAGLYAANCVACHANGQGVPGVDLRSGQFRHASTDEELQLVIQNGIPGTAMPSHAYNTAELTGLVAYIRTMKDYGSKLVELGDAEKGKALFEDQGECLHCHRVNGKGSRVALDLSNAGLTNPPAYLQRALLDPNSIAVEMPENRFIRAVTNKGTTIIGRRLNEDTFTIQLIDNHENLVSIEKADLRSYTILKDSPMPSLKGKFTDAQISDLVAYLVTLKKSPDIGGSGPPPGRGGGGGRGGAAPAGGRGGAPQGTAPIPAPSVPQGDHP
jgi:putative heme-binding domain-containing protein